MAEDFNPDLSITVADTWWELGSWLGKIEAAKRPADRLKVAEQWALEADQREREGFASTTSIKPRRLLDFAETVLRLLERKYRGESIARDVEPLITQPMRYRLKDDGQHLACAEAEETFWALEHALLFRELTAGRSRDDWRHAVTTCADETCCKFIVKTRRDQRFHSGKCRANHANRVVQQARQAKKHGGKGKR